MFPTGWDSATFRDKGTEVNSLSRDKGTAGQAKNLDKGRDGPGQPKFRENNVENDVLKQEKMFVKQEIIGKNSLFHCPLVPGQ